MRRMLFIAGICAAGWLTGLQPGVALDRTAGIRNETGSDLSAAARKKNKKYVAVRRTQPVGHVRGPWMDPSFGPDGRPYPNPYPPHVCSVDQGYGRFTTCDFHND